MSHFFRERFPTVLSLDEDHREDCGTPRPIAQIPSPHPSTPKSGSSSRSLSPVFYTEPGYASPKNQGRAIERSRRVDQKLVHGLVEELGLYSRS